MAEVLLEVLLPWRGLTCNQGCVGLLTDHVRPSPPPLLITTDCDGAALPVVALNVSELALSCIEGVATLIVMGTLIGLPLAVLPVVVSTAFTNKVALYVVPPLSPVASIFTLSDVVAPPVTREPVLAESETNLGAPDAREAVQFSDPPPSLPTLTG